MMNQVEPNSLPASLMRPTPYASSIEQPLTQSVFSPDISLAGNGSVNDREESTSVVASDGWVSSFVGSEGWVSSFHGSEGWVSSFHGSDDDTAETPSPEAEVKDEPSPKAEVKDEPVVLGTPEQPKDAESSALGYNEINYQDVAGIQISPLRQLALRTLAAPAGVEINTPEQPQANVDTDYEDLAIFKHSPLRQAVLRNQAEVARIMAEPAPTPLALEPATEVSTEKCEMLDTTTESVKEYTRRRNVRRRDSQDPRFEVSEVIAEILPSPSVVRDLPTHFNQETSPPDVSPICSPRASIDSESDRSNPAVERRLDGVSADSIISTVNATRSYSPVPSTASTSVDNSLSSEEAWLEDHYRMKILRHILNTIELHLGTSHNRTIRNLSPLTPCALDFSAHSTVTQATDSRESRQHISSSIAGAVYSPGIMPNVSPILPLSPRFPETDSEIYSPGVMPNVSPILPVSLDFPETDCSEAQPNAFPVSSNSSGALSLRHVSTLVIQTGRLDLTGSSVFQEKKGEDSPRVDGGGGTPSSDNDLNTAFMCYSDSDNDNEEVSSGARSCHR